MTHGNGYGTGWAGRPSPANQTGSCGNKQVIQGCLQGMQFDLSNADGFHKNTKCWESRASLCGKDEETIADVIFQLSK